MTKKKILFVEEGVAFGGSVISLSETLKGFQQYEPVVVSYFSPAEMNRLFGSIHTYSLKPRFTYRHKQAFRQRLSSSGTPNLLQSSLMKGYICLQLAYERYLSHRLKQIAVDEKVSLIHGNNEIRKPVLDAARLAGLPVIFHMRGFTSTVGYKSSWSLKVARVVAISKAIKAYACKQLLVPENSINIIYNPVDTSRFQNTGRGDLLRKRYGLKSDDVVAGMYARITEWKGQIYFLQAVINLLKQGIPIKAVIVGDESDSSHAYYQSLIELTKNSGYHQHFIFCGYQPEVQDYYHLSDIIVHASIENEPFGRVLIEAMAAGKPVIATALGAPPEIITDGEDGILVEPSSVTSMEQALFTLATNTNLRLKMGQAGRRKAEKRFSVESAARQLQSLYDGVLGRH